MPRGPGRYDDLATIVREQAEAEAVVVIVLRGAAGSGFSIQSVSPEVVAGLPAMLRFMADEIEASSDG